MQQKAVVYLLIAGIVALSALGSACARQTPTATPQPVAPATPMPPTAVAPTATPAAEAAVERALAALSALDQTRYFQFRGQVQTRQHLSATADGRSVLDQSTAVTTRADGARSLEAGQANARLHRSLTVDNGPSGVLQEGEVRRAGGVTYISGRYAQTDPSYPPLPQGWMRVYGPSTLLYWPVMSGISPGEMVDWVSGSAAQLLSGRSVEQLRGIFAGSLASAMFQAETLGDGTPVEVVTVILKASALPASVHGVSPDDPVAAAIYKAATGTPVQHRFILDSSDRLRGWEQTIALDAEGLDVAGVAGFPAGARLDISAVQSVAFYVSVPEQPGTIAAPETEATARLPSRSHSAGHPAPVWGSLDEFDAALNAAVSGDSVDSFWQQVTDSGPMPLLFGDYGVFLYRGPAESVAWSGDWPGGINSIRLGDTDMWMVAVQFLEDVRAEYQIEVDGKAMLDPLNPAVETGGLGSKSVLTMPGYVFPAFTLPREGIAQGKLTDNLTLSSKVLGYEVNYRAYTPAGYEELKSLPVLYVTDGQDYIEFGKMVTVLDNLIADGKVQPLLAVFIDPRDTVTGRNQREEQFLNNPKYGQFIVEELVPAVDAAFKTNRSADARALLGASYGGYFGAYFALRHSDTFHLIAIQSPAFWWDATIIEEYKKVERLPVKVFMNVGRFNDGTYHTRLMREVLEEKGYPLLYLESNEGHTYGNWRGKLEAMLTYFLGVKK